MDLKATANDFKALRAAALVNATKYYNKGWELVKVSQDESNPDYDAQHLAISYYDAAYHTLLAFGMDPTAVDELVGKDVELDYFL